MNRLNNILKQRLAAAQVAQSEHPSADTLAAFAEQSLKAPQRESVLEHLAACDDCRQTVMLATSEVDAEQVAPALSRKPVLQFPGAMRWASLAAAIAVAVGVGLLINEHESAPRQAVFQGTVRSNPATPPAQPAPEAAKTETDDKNFQTKQDVFESSAANKPAPLNEKKKPSLATSHDRVSLSGANAANAAPAASGISAGNGLSSGRNQVIAGALVPNRDSDQKAATYAAKAVQAAPAPSYFPPAPAAEAFSGGALDANINGRSTKAELAPASGNQKAEVLQGSVTDQSGAAVSGAEVSVTNVATGATRVVESGANGSYRVDPLPAGIYKIQVASPGFTTATAERVDTLASASTTQNFQLHTGAASETVEVSAAAPQNVSNAETRAALQAEQIPLKTSPAAAVPGSLRRAQSAQFRAGIVKWAISDTGQLQRTLSDGETANVQPAPGMTVKAVASEGIEVWAAGSQSDLSAKEWTQRSVLFHSSDAGKNWSRVDGPWKDAIVGLSLSKGSLGVTTQEGMTWKGIWTTSDGGKTWTFLSIKTKG